MHAYPNTQALFLHMGGYGIFLTSLKNANRINT